VVERRQTAHATMSASSYAGAASADFLLSPASLTAARMRARADAREAATAAASAIHQPHANVHDTPTARQTMAAPASVSLHTLRGGAPGLALSEHDLAASSSVPPAPAVAAGAAWSTAEAATESYKPVSFTSRQNQRAMPALPSAAASSPSSSLSAGLTARDLAASAAVGGGGHGGGRNAASVVPPAQQRLCPVASAGAHFDCDAHIDELCANSSINASDSNALGGVHDCPHASCFAAANRCALVSSLDFILLQPTLKAFWRQISIDGSVVF
jgi:hypothetical protein